MSFTSEDKTMTSPKKMNGPTPFNFHCIICFEQFDHEERYPVVLPCGHTYLCAKCSKRLKKCMECRTPLFMVKPTTTPVLGPSQSSGRTSPVVTRGRRYAAPSPPPTPPPQRQEIPLPLPKNVLLLSLMETAEREANAVRFAKLKRSLNKVNSVDTEADGTLFHMDPIDETNVQTMSLVGECIEEDVSATFSFEEDEDAYIWSTINHISSTCGTYAVADPAGLMVLPKKPSKEVKSDVSTVFENVSLSNGKDHTNSSTYELPYRSRVQVVHIEDGWAQLARNRGYVKVDSTQLVKVGGPNDKACEIEGMLLQVDNRRKEISRKQTELSRIENGLERELDKALLVQFSDSKRYVLDEENDVAEAAQRLSCQEKENQEEQHSPKPDNSVPPKTPPSRQLRTPSPTTSPAIVTRLLGLPKLSPTPVQVTIDANTPSPATIPKRRPRAQPVSPSSVDKYIDFRTGFSGHCALTQSFARHPQRNPRSVHRMMGEHKGLGLPSSKNCKSLNAVLCKSPDRVD